ncbi:MAG: hypothetical protein ABEJ59_04075 [Halanaeroarchaeum sp.]
MADVDRGVSTVFGYTLNVAIATILVTGLLFAAGSVVDDQRQQAVRSELTVVGQRFTANLETADRLSRSGEDASVRLETHLPRTVAGVGYRIDVVTTGGTATAVARTETPDVRVTVPIANETPVQATSVSGGPLVVVGNATGLEVRHG